MWIYLQMLWCRWGQEGSGLRQIGMNSTWLPQTTLWNKKNWKKSTPVYQFRGRTLSAAVNWVQFLWETLVTGVSRVFCVRPTATRTLVSQLFSFFLLLCMQHHCSSALTRKGNSTIFGEPGIKRLDVEEDSGTCSSLRKGRPWRFMSSSCTPGSDLCAFGGFLPLALSARVSWSRRWEGK